MTREELWQLIKSKNPALNGKTVRLKAVQLRRLFDMVWDEAKRDGQYSKDMPDFLKGLGF